LFNSSEIHPNGALAHQGPCQNLKISHQKHDFGKNFDEKDKNEEKFRISRSNRKNFSSIVFGPGQTRAQPFAALRPVQKIEIFYLILTKNTKLA